MLTSLQWALLLVFGGYGLVAAVRPRLVATLGEVLDARGSRADPSDIEATSANVLLTRLTGVLTLLILAGLLMRGG